LVTQANVIIGNTVLYGATAGRLFAAGQAGERFAVRNSGADVVVEGCGANGCEYMTGGTAVILGPVGDNFAAGMSGGMAFVYDEAERFPSYVNGDSVIWQRIDSNFWEARLQALIGEHVAETQSRFARRLLNDWALVRDHFWQVVPKEMMSRLEQPLSDRVEEQRA
ncbi:MAG TPA: glutamate synthase large subunit, partial [Dongiaceae bacterium]|nr:glutamate synthase large subunit [Dongiaceae bacterium]